MGMHPNLCFICSATENLKRCSRCHMVNYCGSDHQKEHWPAHKDFCKVLEAMIKEQGVSHIFEKLRGADFETWKTARENTWKEVQSRLNRPIQRHEKIMILTPKACFVCYETSQELKPCSNCFSVYFCKKHPSSPLHDKDCEEIKFADKLSGILILERAQLQIIKAIAVETPFYVSTAPLTSIKEYLDQLTGLGKSLTREMKVLMSESLSLPLTLVNSLQKLDYRPSELSFHMIMDFRGANIASSWEIVLHFIPSLKVLKVEHLEDGVVSTQEIDLCHQCTSRGKRLICETSPIDYLEYIKAEKYKKPDIIGFFYPEVPDKHMKWEELQKIWKHVNCPAILTTGVERWSKLLGERLRSMSWGSLICYEGLNNFGSLRPWVEWTDGSVSKLNQFMIVTKAPKQQKVNRESK